MIIRLWLSNNLKQKKIQRLLDLGCGTGRWFHTMESVDFVLGADFSFDMLKKAKEKIIEKGYINTELIRCEISNLPLKKESFDYCISIGVLAEHVPLNDEVFLEVGRILKSGGIFSFTAQKIGEISRLKMKGLQFLFPVFPYFLKEKIELQIKTFHKRLDHNKQSITELAKRHNFKINKIEVKSLNKSDFYFISAEKEYR
ncbi:MAG: class I SAM-dependent methyltransferase [Candidatus Thermoplasmatota archaeon]|nr:class I SAM-dependent methyltransferase [Candidatus Thermoplasmatota archaeon]